MIRKNTISILFCFMSFSCSINDNIHTYKLLKNKSQEVINEPSATLPSVKANDQQSLIWEKPNSWILSEGSSMRLASFSVPYKKGMGDLSVIQLAGSGGGLQANINRWRSQLNLSSWNMIEIEKNIKTLHGKLGNYSMIEIMNNKTGDAFLCAIIVLSNKTLFVKLSIKFKGIKEVKEDFKLFCSSIDLN